MNWGGEQTEAPGHEQGPPPPSGVGPQNGEGPGRGDWKSLLQPAPRAPTDSTKASHAFPIVPMHVWPAHFTPAMKAADLLALLAAGHDPNVTLGKTESVF